ncbi:MAG: gp53-like domain-containing protein [Cetobacterium sp.]
MEQVDANTGAIATANSKIEQNKNDILLKLNSHNPTTTGQVTFDGGGSYNPIVKHTTYPALTLFNTDLNKKGHLAMNSDGKVILGGSDISSQIGQLWTDGNCTISKSANGWVKLANGLIIQWGKTIDCGHLDGKLINFPVSFTSLGSFNFFATRNGIASYANFEVYYVTDYVKSSMNSAKIKGMYHERGVMKLVGSPDEYTWLAIGY